MTENERVSIRVNGADRDLPAGITATELLAALGLPDRGVAVALDDTVHPRSAWDRPLPDGARVEILTAVQGG
ncbi:sulfur carrier protein ThiS [Williamsia sp. M5A3_1d]